VICDGKICFQEEKDPISTTIEPKELMPTEVTETTEEIQKVIKFFPQTTYF